jgi:hypothetical protein
MMQPYKGYFIQDSPLLVHPFSPEVELTNRCLKRKVSELSY